MNTRRNFVLFTFLFAVVASSVVCNFGQEVEVLQDLDAEDSTRVAQTAESIALTQGAQATETASPSPVPPTPTPTEDTAAATLDAFLTEQASQPDFSILNPPPPVAVMNDPAGDSVVCTDGSSVDDAAVDIITLMVYDPAALNYDHAGWLLQIGLGTPADETFANDWSAALLSSVAVTGTVTYTVTLNETHNGITRTGELDLASGQTIAGTQATTFIDDNGYIWFEIPRDAGYLQVQAYHLPSSDMTFEQRRCDVAPDESAYTLQLPSE